MLWITKISFHTPRSPKEAAPARIGSDPTRAPSMEDKPTKLKAPRRKARSSVTSARNTDTRVSVAQAGRSEDKEKHTPARRTRPRIKDKFEERKAI